MILAVHLMSADAQVICYGIAIAAFVLAAASALTGRWNPSGTALIGVGLARALSQPSGTSSPSPDACS